MERLNLFLLAVMLAMHSCLPVVATDPLYTDPTQPVDVRVADLLGRMTLAEKIGQMTQIERAVCNESVMHDYFIGTSQFGEQEDCSAELCGMYSNFPGSSGLNFQWQQGVS